MKRKLLVIALVWIILLGFAVLSADRDTYVWTAYSTQSASLVKSSSEAEQLQADYDAMMVREQAAAEQRTKDGLWGTEESENDYSETLDALTDDGFNLMWGDYEAEIYYDASEAFFMSPFSVGRACFIRSEGAELPAGKKATAVLRFTLTDSTEHLCFQADLPEGARIRSITVRKDMPFPVDQLPYAVFAAILLTILLVRGWDRGPDAAGRRRDTLILMATAAFACMPLLWEGLQDGHDLIFHLNRIEGIASALRCGQFPVRIHASTLQGYGYASSIFYPELFLYFPAVLRNLGVSLLDSLRIFEICINFLSAFSCYTCVRRLVKDRKTALLAAMLYTLSIYRLVNLYVRATQGESLAMIFFPMLILGMAEILLRDEKRWPVLAFAMTGIVMSHLLSTLFGAAFCFLAALLCAPRLLREPKRILAILKAALVTVLCSCWFFVPMLSYLQEKISTSVVIDASQNVLKLGSYLVILSGNNGTISADLEDFAYTIGVVPGIALLLGCAVLLVRMYMEAKPRTLLSEPERLCRAFLLMGGLALLCATDFFPWKWLVSLPHPVSTLFMQMQFPWRLVSIAVPLLVTAAAMGYLSLRPAGLGFALMLTLSVITAGYTMQCFVQDPQVLKRDGYVDSRIGQFEYTYVSTEKDALKPGQFSLSGAKRMTITDYEKNGTDLRFTILLPDGGKFVDLPLLYYPGYHAAFADGTEMEVKRGTNNRVRLYAIRGGEVTQVHVWFQEPLTWRISEAVSLIGFILLAFFLYRTRRREAKT